MAAFVLAMLLITGLIVGLWAYILFGALALTAVACTSIGTIEYTKHKKTARAKKEKADKLKTKISKKQKSIDKTTKKLEALQEKEQTPRTTKKVARLTKKLEKQNKKLNKQIDKLEKLEKPKKNEQAEEVVNEQLDQNNVKETNEEVTPIVVQPETDINTEMLGGEKQLPAKPVDLSPDNVNANRNAIKESLAAMERGKPQSVEERATMIADINNKVTAACPDGMSVDNVNADDKALYQSYINFRTAYIAEQSAKATYEKALAEGAENVAALEADYKAARAETNNQLNNMYAATKTHEASRQTAPVQETENDEEATR